MTLISRYGRVGIIIISNKPLRGASTSATARSRRGGLAMPMWGRVIALCLVIALAPVLAHAQTSAPQSEAQREAEIKAAYDAGIKAGTRGPATVTLLDEATL